MDEQPDPREVVAGLLGDTRLLRACGERDMGALFRLLNTRGVSTRRIAVAAEISQGRLYDYMNGKARVEKLSIFEQIADAFRVPGHFLGLARRSWEPAPTMESSPSTSVIRSADGDDLAAMNAFRGADRQSGGSRLYGAVLRYLADRVAPRLVDIATELPVFAAAAAPTEMAGWMAHDSALDDRAERHFSRALSLARVSGDAPLEAHIAASSSHLMLETGDAVRAVHWANLGLDLTRKGPRLLGLVARHHAMRARALAAIGQHTPAEQALDQAHAALGGVTDDVHPWLSPFDEATLAGEAALALTDLGRFAEALKHAERAVALGEESRTRSLALSRITLVRVHLHLGEPDAAVHVGHRLLTTSPALGSLRVMHQLDDLRRLLDLHRAYHPVREYLARFDEARRARMLLLADVIPPPRGGTS